MRRLALVLLLPTLLSGCALFESKATRAMHASPDYKGGYADGCASANTPGANPRADNQRRDDDSFSGNAAYRTGWQEGYGACRSMAQMSGPMPGPLSGP